MKTNPIHRPHRRLRRPAPLRLAPAAPRHALPPPRPARAGDFLDLCLYPGMTLPDPAPDLAYPTAV
jgi:hypothetical protein